MIEIRCGSPEAPEHRVTFTEVPAVLNYQRLPTAIREGLPVKLHFERIYELTKIMDQYDFSDILNEACKDKLKVSGYLELLKFSHKIKAWI